MIEFLVMIMHDLLQCVTVFYCVDKLLDEKTNYKSFRTIFITTIFAISLRINWLYTNSYFTTIFSYTLVAIANYVLRDNKNLNRDISASFVCFIVVMISEIIMSCILMLFFNDKEILNLTSIPLYKNMISSSIYLLSLFVVKIKYFKSIYKLVLDITNKTKIITIITSILLFIGIFNMSYVVIYYNKNVLMRLFSNALLIIVYFILLIKSFNIKVKYKEISDKYSNTIEALKDYEKMIDFYKVNNHENKNNFLTIRNMLEDKDQKIKDFIDNIIDNRIMDDEKLNMDSSNIPEGGIRAVIYSKLLEMKNRKIKFDLETDFKVRRFVLGDNKDKTILDICNILGVFLDNAIHESVKLKDKAYIKVTLAIKNENLHISIKNKFKGTIDVSKIDKSGYTTKGDGHGYGLSLVKNILSEIRCFENKRKITKITFEQILIINKK